jgi:hypothetical protein
MNQNVIKVQRYLDKDEIKKHLEKVEFIIMAAPSTRQNPKYPIHFTIFLNTQDDIPFDIQDKILDKFCAEHDITVTHDVLQSLGNVAFADVGYDTIMPQYLFKDEDASSLEHTKMHIIDFEADALGFKEPKEGQTGWSYSYEE